jgi:hypothetical protein
MAPRASWVTLTQRPVTEELFPVHMEATFVFGFLYNGIRALESGPGNDPQPVKGNRGKHIVPVILYEPDEPFPVHTVDLHVHGHGLGKVVLLPAEDRRHSRMDGEIRVGGSVNINRSPCVKEAVFAVELYL